MSNRKLKNLDKIWKEEGYIVQIEQTRSSEGVLMEIDMTLKMEDGSKVDFHRDWLKLRTLAQRQDFYLLPVSRSTDSVKMLNRYLINGVGKLLYQQSKDISQSYWYLQGEEQLLEFESRLHICELAVDSIRKDIVKLGACPPAAFRHIEIIINERYAKYQKLVIELTVDMIKAELLTKEELQVQVGIMNDYINKW